MYKRQVQYNHISENILSFLNILVVSVFKYLKYNLTILGLLATESNFSDVVVAMSLSRGDNQLQLERASVHHG